MSGWTRRTERAIGTLAVLAAALLLAACSTQPVIAPSKFPTPMVRPLPGRVGLYLDPAFSSYVHHDTPAQGPKQDVQVGPASSTLFREFLTAQFADLVAVSKAPPGGVPPGVEAVLAPAIEEVQIASPKSKTDQFYEAWIRYRLHLVAPDGSEITSWELSAYGKHRGAFIGGGNEALTAAVEDAMRDAAAGMALVFRDEGAFRSLLANRPPAAAPAPAATTTPPASPAPTGGAS